MKFAWKIFIVTYVIIVLSFGLGGFVLVDMTFENNINSELAGVVESNKYLVNSYMAMNNVDEVLSTNMSDTYANSVTVEDEHSRVYIGNVTRVAQNVSIDWERLTEGKRLTRIIEKDGVPHIQVVSALSIPGRSLVFVENLQNISDVYQSRDIIYRQFQVILLIVAVVSGLLLYILSRRLTSPLKKLSGTAKSIGEGRFDERVKVDTSVLGDSEEIHSLAEDFNKMAGYVEQYIEELKEENRRREEFVGNFTHELKTPLTSIIGYSDLLRTYDLDSEKRRQFAEFIYKEGSRLESLALHLLDLLVMRKNEFELKDCHTRALFYDVKQTVVFLTDKYHAKLYIDCEESMVLAEGDLLKTLIYNLVDNGCKAITDNEQNGKASIINIMGCIEGSKYRVTISDNGRGIPETEIDKITEAFYMVDKSRARTMGGAGLGLALCQEIAEIHGDKLLIESEEGVGTQVSFLLQVNDKGGQEDE